MLRMDSDLPARSNGDTARSKKNKKNAPTLNLKGGRTNPDSVDQDRDIEKGFGTQTRIEATSSQQQVVPESSFDMDSPLAGGNRAGAGGEKGRGWMRMLGRK